ncbi:glycoside hydrolase family 88/105 protein [Chitinophaga arvensicola]|uniref:Rhamnogalacturonyl hydrolase YesR n=1 Tax=Chitinophaga arvensicola TaxID=29529 RepID=A0A1I0RTH2_9BACT|nr:glycoside hydrolase family 88 protein [Chitinophaga arvensicola]SEW44703.1 Rhamnogalacturonyl hydrolase YesR [Chitinophaga arvensicola]
MKKRLFIIPILLMTCLLVNAQSSIRDTAAIFQTMKKVADWQWNTLETAGWKTSKKDWTSGVLLTGMMAWANLAQEEKYYDKLKQVGEDNHWQIGNDRQCADDYCVAQTYIQLYNIFKNPLYIRDFKSMADTLVTLPHTESLQWGNRIDYREWAWCDALYMGPPALAYLTQATGDYKYLEKCLYLWKKSSDFLYDKDAHLFYRDSRYFTKREANGKKVFWSRGNGWVMGGLVRVLSVLPDSSRAKPALIKQLKEMSAAIAALQQPDGSWHASLLDPAAYPVKETSGTAFFCYALTWGVNNGYLSRRKYKPVIDRAWQSLTDAIHEDGKLGFVQPQGASPDKVTFDDTDVYGVGAFLLAGVEMMKFNARVQQKM